MKFLNYTQTNKFFRKKYRGKIHNFSENVKFFFLRSFTLCCPRIASNDDAPAAWRSGGFHCTFCGLLPFMSARRFLRSYCRRCAKPHVVC